MPHTPPTKKFSRACLVLIVLITGTYLFGWLFRIENLIKSLPHTMGMNPTSAFVFLIASAGLIYIDRLSGRSRSILSFSTGSFMVLVGAVGLLSHYGFGFPIDEVFFYDQKSQFGATYSYKMPITSGGGFVIAGIAIFLCTWSRGRLQTASIISQVLIFILILVSFFFLIGYLYQIPLFDVSLSDLNLSLRSVICFFLLSNALIFYDEDSYFARQISSGRTGGRLARKLFPVIILMPLALGYFDLQFGHHFNLSDEFSISLLIFTLVNILVFFLYRNVDFLNRQDETIQREQAEVLRLNRELTQSNHEIMALNEELTSSNDRLLSVNQHLEQTNEKVVEQSIIIAQHKDEILNRVLDSSTEVIWSLDLLNPSSNYVSKAAGLLLGLASTRPPSDIQFWKNVTNQEDSLLHYADELTRKGICEITLRVQTKTSLVWLYGTIRQTTNENGLIIKQEGILSDVTSLKESQEKLQTSATQLADFKRAIDNSSIVSRADLKGIIIDVNQKFEEISGYTKAELIGRTHNLINSGHHARSFWIEMWQTVSRGKVWRAEVKNRAKNGTYYWVDTFIMPFINDQGKVVEYLSIRNDITSKKEFEDKITSIARELSSLIENANVPIFGIDRRGHINEWNQTAEQVTGCKRTDLLGKRWIDEFILSENHFEVTERIDRVVQDGTSFTNFEIPTRTKNGKVRKLLLSASPRFTPTKEISGIILVGQDITELSNYRDNLERMVHERTKELNDALKNERNVVELKSKFVSIASHEFRTPLSTITLVAGTLRKYHPNMADAEVNDQLDSIMKQVNHMTYLLDDVLTIGRADAGKIPVKKTIIPIHEFIQSVTNEVSQAMGKTHEIVIRENLMSNEIFTDEKLLRNIIINLLSNAIKFSPGSSVVRMNLVNDSDMLFIDVIDSGIGIPEKDQRNLFEPFYRASNVSTIQGTGLGLSIIKKAVDLLSGSIKIASIQGEGTTISVAIPNSND